MCWTTLLVWLKSLMLYIAGYTRQGAHGEASPTGLSRINEYRLTVQIQCTRSQHVRHVTLRFSGLPSKSGIVRPFRQDDEADNSLAYTTPPSVFSCRIVSRTHVYLRKGCRRRAELVCGWSDYGGVTCESGRFRDWKVHYFSRCKISQSLPQ